MRISQPLLLNEYNKLPINAIINSTTIAGLKYTCLAIMPNKIAPINVPTLTILTARAYHVSLRPRPGSI